MNFRRVGICLAAAVGLALVLLESTCASAQEYDPKFFSGLHWRSIGPFRGGRTKAAAGVPNQPNVFYIGVGNGGGWKTNQYGRTWTPVFDHQPTRPPGPVAVAPSHPNVVYLGR